MAVQAETAAEDVLHIVQLPVLVAQEAQQRMDLQGAADMLLPQPHKEMEEVVEELVLLGLTLLL
jgi:hypothetical protein